MDQDPVSRRWEPEDEDDYEAANAELKERFAVWVESAGPEVDSNAPEAPIHYKWGYLDGHLTRWTCADLDEVYLELHPAKVMVEADEIDDVLTEARAFISFLADTGLLDEASESADVLVDHLGRIEERFRANMADVSRYSFGKRLWTTAEAEGVRLDDPEAVEAFMAEFNARPRAEREAVLGRSPQLRGGHPMPGRFTPPGTRPLAPSAKKRRRRR